jgi:hypothetical protein
MSDRVQMVEIVVASDRPQASRETPSTGDPGKTVFVRWRGMTGQPNLRLWPGSPECTGRS